jgi:hypothetical protein
MENIGKFQKSFALAAGVLIDGVRGRQLLYGLLTLHIQR